MDVKQIIASFMAKRQQQTAVQAPPYPTPAPVFPQRQNQCYAAAPPHQIPVDQ